MASNIGLENKLESLELELEERKKIKNQKEALIHRCGIGFGLKDTTFAMA